LMNIIALVFILVNCIPVQYESLFRNPMQESC
jgi:hypothetical protein